MQINRPPRLLAALAMFVCALPHSNAAFAQTAKPAAGSGRPTICVTSSIGNRYEIQTIGLMVFGNDLKTANVSAWGIDSLVVQRLSAGLASKYAVRSTNLSSDVIKSVSVGGESIFAGSGSRDALKAALSQQAKAGCAYVVIAKPVAATFAGTNQTMEGLGIIKRNAGLITTYVTHSTFMVKLYDARTGEWIRPPMATLFGGGSSTRDATEADWPASPQAAVQSTRLREAARRGVTIEADQAAYRIRRSLGEPQ